MVTSITGAPTTPLATCSSSPRPRCPSGWPDDSATGHHCVELRGYDGFFVIDVEQPDDLARVTSDLASYSPAAGFDLVVDIRPSQDPAPWIDHGASWVLTRLGPFDLDVAQVRAIIEAGPG